MPSTDTHDRIRRIIRAGEVDPEIRTTTLTRSPHMHALAFQAREHCEDLRVRDLLDADTPRRLRHLAPRAGDVVWSTRVTYGWTAEDWRALLTLVETATSALSAVVGSVPLSGSRQSMERTIDRMERLCADMRVVAEHLERLEVRCRG